MIKKTENYQADLCFVFILHLILAKKKNTHDLMFASFYLFFTQFPSTDCPFWITEVHKSKVLFRSGRSAAPNLFAKSLNLWVLLCVFLHGGIHKFLLCSQFCIPIF